MTKEQREKTKLALRRYGTRQWAACPANAGWRLAIERTIEYYQQEDPLRADLLRLRYLERRTEDDTIERLHIGRSTYQKSDHNPYRLKRMRELPEVHSHKNPAHDLSSG